MTETGNYYKGGLIIYVKQTRSEVVADLWLIN